MNFRPLAIETELLSYDIGNLTIIEDMSIQIAQGDYAAIIGPNGGGKTTLMRLLLGLAQKTKGTIKLFGMPIEQFNSWHDIGYVPQQVLQVDAAFPATVYEVVRMGRTVLKKPWQRFGASDRAIIEDVMEKLGVTELKDKLIGQLSGGQRQRVLIARALVTQPKLLILDEPNTGVDITSQKKFYALLKALNSDYGMTIVFITHDIGVIADDIKNVICINRKLLGCNAPQELLTCSTMSELYGVDAHLLHHHH